MNIFTTNFLHFYIFIMHIFSPFVVPQKTPHSLFLSTPRFFLLSTWLQSYQSSIQICNKLICQLKRVKMIDPEWLVQMIVKNNTYQIFRHLYIKYLLNRTFKNFVVFFTGLACLKDAVQGDRLLLPTKFPRDSGIHFNDL